MRQLKLKEMIWLFVIGFAFESCTFWDNPEPIPAYIYVQPFELSADAATEGSNSHKISDVWVFAGGQNIGVYSLPAIVPVLLEDNLELQLFPGIKNNGIAASPVIYPFYDRYRFSGQLESARIDTINPSTSYIDNARFSLIERFDDSHTFKFDLDGNLNTRIEITNNAEDVFEGGGSGRIQLDTINSIVEVASQASFADLPDNGQSIYLEMDYKSEIELAVSLVGFDVSGSSFPGTVLFLNPKSEWNKVYFDVTDTVLFFKDAATAGFRILIAARMPKNTNGQFTMDRAKILVDNVKLVHF